MARSAAASKTPGEEQVEPCWGGPLANADHIHRFPAKMALGLANHFFETVVPSQRSIDDPGEVRFHDPFAGSGTTMLVGLHHGYEVSGTELILPSARLARAKCTRLLDHELEEVNQLLEANPLSYKRRVKNGWPDMSTWYPPQVMRALQDMRDWVMSQRSEPYFPHLYAGLSQTCWDVSSADQEVMVPTNSKRSPDNSDMPPGDVRRTFQGRTERVLDGQEALSELGIERANVDLYKGDCLDKDCWPESCDLLLTSPPYGLGINYIRAASLPWRVLEPEAYANGAHKEMIGRRNNHNVDTDNLPDGIQEQDWWDAAKEETPRRHIAFCQYLKDLRDFFDVAKERLSDDGLFGLVLGNPEMVGNRVPLVDIARGFAADAGFQEPVEPVKDEIRRRFQTSQRRNSTGPISHEYLVVLSH